jgi:pyruvate dehydrogenase E1 component alpha subunit
LIEAKTYRYRGHYEGDPMVYRSKEELEEWKNRDAIDTYRTRLLDAKVFKEQELDQVDQEVQAQLDEAVKFASETPVPQQDETLQGVYEDTHDGKVF